jgi:hypothetical protein
MGGNSITCDNVGMDANSGSGPGPPRMGTDVPPGNDVHNKDAEDLDDKIFAVPRAAPTLGTANKRSTLDVPKGPLEEASGFYKTRCPSMSDRTWAIGVQKFYGTP